MERNIVIEGKTNEWYEKAIFVLKDPKTTKIPNNLVSYAEAYTKTTPISNHKKVVRASGMSNLRWIDDFFGGSLGVLGIATNFYFLF